MLAKECWCGLVGTKTARGVCLFYLALDETLQLGSATAAAVSPRPDRARAGASNTLTTATRGQRTNGRSPTTPSNGGGAWADLGTMAGRKCRAGRGKCWGVLVVARFPCATMPR